MVTDRQLRRFRKQYNLSREAIADMVGVSAQTIWRWEKGERIPAPEGKLLESIMAKERTA